MLGATGAVGSAAVQIAAGLGARVTALAGAANLTLARELGAETALDYRAGLPPGPFDVILDSPGVLGWPGARPLLAPGGRLGMVTAGLGATLGAALRPRRGGIRLCAAVIKESRAAMERLLALHAAGHYRPQLGAVLPLDRVAEAHEMASSGHKRGNVVVRMT